MKIRPSKYWTPESLIKALEDVAGSNGGLVTSPALAQRLGLREQKPAVATLGVFLNRLGKKGEYLKRENLPGRLTQYRFVIAPPIDGRRPLPKPTAPPAPKPAVAVKAGAAGLATAIELLVHEAIEALRGTVREVVRDELARASAHSATLLPVVGTLPANGNGHANGNGRIAGLLTGTGETLPEHTKHGWHLQYSERFQKAVKKLNSGDQFGVVRALTLLAEHGQTYPGLGFSALAPGAKTLYGRSRDMWAIRASRGMRVILDRDSPRKTFMVINVQRRGQLRYSER